MTTRRPSFRLGSSFRATSEYAKAREMPRSSAASSTVSVTRCSMGKIVRGLFPPTFPPGDGPGLTRWTSPSSRHVFDGHRVAGGQLRWPCRSHTPVALDPTPNLTADDVCRSSGLVVGSGMGVGSATTGTSDRRGQEELRAGCGRDGRRLGANEICNVPTEALLGAGIWQLREAPSNGPNGLPLRLEPAALCGAPTPSAIAGLRRAGRGACGRFAR